MNHLQSDIYNISLRKALSKNTQDARAMIDNFQTTSSGKKVSKKVRQLYKRELIRQAQKRTNELYKTFEEHIRPRPKFIPTVIWKMLQRIVLIHYIT